MPSWGHVVKEIQSKRDIIGGDSAVDQVRQNYLNKLHNLTQRNIICYYSGFLSKPQIEGIAISDEDKHGFMDCVGGIDRDKGLDLFLHTPGGNVAATESIVNYLRKMFGDNIRAIVPQIAMSAGTLIACSCKEIIMGKHSNLGPVDPHIYGFSAYAVTNEIKLAYEEIKADVNKVEIWKAILSRYTPGFVQLCYYGIDNSTELIKKFLRENMFKDDKNSVLIEKIANELNDLSKNKSHDKHLHIEDCKNIGLNIVELENKENKALQDAVLSVHHCYMYSLSNTPVFKMIENHAGRRYLKTIQPAPMQFKFSPLVT